MYRRLVLMPLLLFFFISVRASDRIRISYSAISGSQAILWVTQQHAEDSRA